MPRYQTERLVSAAKQRERREAISVAVSRVLRNEGVAACTVRRIASELDVSNGVIHYYFTSTEELVDVGYARLTNDYFNILSNKRGTFSDPKQDFWHIVICYVLSWTNNPAVSRLWMEYYVLAARANKMKGVTENSRRTIDLFAAFLEPIDGGKFLGKAESVFRHLTGAVLSGIAITTDIENVLCETAAILHLATPDLKDVVCAKPRCWCHGR